MAVVDADRSHRRSTCPICGRGVLDGETVVFDHGDLIHTECSRVRRWPPLDGVKVSGRRRSTDA
jgi:hypothetical protein